MKYKKYEKKEYRKVIALKKKNKSLREISKLLNINYDTIRSWINRGHKPAIYYNGSKKHKRIAYLMSKKNIIYYSIPKLNNPNLAYLIGVLLSDGNLRKTGFRISVIDKEFTINVQEVIYKLFKVNCLIKVRDNIKWQTQYELNLNSIQIRDYLFNLCYKRGIKRVPAKYFKAENKIIWALLQGIYDGDGSVIIGNRSDRRYKYYNISLSVQHRVFAKDVQLLLKKIGIKSGIAKDRQYFKVIIYGKKILDIKKKIFRIKRKREKYE